MKTEKQIREWINESIYILEQAQDSDPSGDYSELELEIEILKVILK